jgi:hypothetical protein
VLCIAKINPSFGAGVVVPADEETEKGNRRQLLEIDHPSELQNALTTAQVVHDVAIDTAHGLRPRGGLSAFRAAASALTRVSSTVSAPRNSTAPFVPSQAAASAVSEIVIDKK